MVSGSKGYIWINETYYRNARKILAATLILCIFANMSHLVVTC